MVTILLFLLILAILILVHELGHFAMAKLFGVKVEEFGLGFPPKLWARTYGETTYTLNALPFGGFVKIFGEDAHTAEVDMSQKHRSFYYKPKWIQAIILSAGVVMNILFAYILISAGFMAGLPAPVDAYPAGQVTDPHLVITAVLPNSPADKAGLIGGDVIVSASAGKHTLTELSAESVSELINKSQSPVSISYRTTDTAPIHTVDVIPNDTLVSGRHAIGITMDVVGIIKLPFGQALITGAVTTIQLLKGIVVGLYSFFAGLLTFHSDLSQVSGPIGIARVVGQASSIGFIYLLSLVALISLNLAVINLIPFPALDGGRLFFIVIELITRRKISPKVVQWVNGVSFALLVGLMVIVTVHDIWGLV